MLTGLYAKGVGNNAPVDSMWFQLGANMDQRERVFIGTMTAQGLGVRDRTSGEMVSISSPDQANRTIGSMDQAARRVNQQRADLGAYQNRLEHVINGIGNGAENRQAPHHGSAMPTWPRRWRAS